MPRRLIAQAVCLLMITGMAFAQSQPLPQAKASKPAPKKDLPEIPLAESRLTLAYDTYDFGDVPRGTSVTHDFPVTNTGKDTLIISSIKAG
jgi:hypothetical protein